MSEDQVYEVFIELMFNAFTEDEMAYAHHVQLDAIRGDEIDGIA